MNVKLYTRTAELIASIFQNKLPLPTIIVQTESNGPYADSMNKDSSDHFYIIFPPEFDFSNPIETDAFILKHLYSMHLSKIQHP